MYTAVGIITGISIIVFLRIFMKRYSSWSKNRRAITDTVKDISCEKPHWLLGHLHLIKPTQESLYYAVESIKRFPKQTCMWFGRIVVYLSFHHPELAKTILLTEEPKDDNVYRFLRPLIGEGLLISSGEKWKRHRKLLTPAFHFDALKRHLVCMNETTKEMLKKWGSNNIEAVSVEVFNDVRLMTLDSILRCVMSRKTDCQSGGDRDYLNAVKTATEIAMGRLYQPLQQIDFLFYLTTAGRRFKEAVKVAHEYTEAAILERKSNMKIDEVKRLNLDFLDILLMAKDEHGVGLSHQEICDEVNTFVFGGHDTVTSGISWAFYNLAKHQDHQERCREEVKSVIGDKLSVEWDDLPKLCYLTMFIKESLRLYPPVFGIGRKLSQPVYFSRGFGSDQFFMDCSHVPKDASKTVPAGMNIGVSIFMLHRNPYIWKNPNIFNPLRFSLENVSRRSAQAYLPFSLGPRKCIGQNFAMNEMKVVLSLALLRYRFTVDESYPEPEMVPFITLRPRTGIHVNVETV